MTVLSRLIVTTQTTAPIYGVPVQRVVAIPPSSIDPWTAHIRVRINGLEISRQYDPDSEATW